MTIFSIILPLIAAYSLYANNSTNSTTEEQTQTLYRECARDLCGLEHLVDTPLESYERALHQAKEKNIGNSYLAEAQEIGRKLERLLPTILRKKVIQKEEISDRVVGSAFVHDLEGSYYDLIQLTSNLDAIVEKNISGKMEIDKEATLEKLGDFSKREQDWFLQAFEYMKESNPFILKAMQTLGKIRELTFHAGTGFLETEIHKLLNELYPEAGSTRDAFHKLQEEAKSLRAFYANRTPTNSTQTHAFSFLNEHLGLILESSQSFDFSPPFLKYRLLTTVLSSYIFRVIVDSELRKLTLIPLCYPISPSQEVDWQFNCFIENSSLEPQEDVSPEVISGISEWFLPQFVESYQNHLIILDNSHSRTKEETFPYNREIIRKILEIINNSNHSLKLKDDLVFQLYKTAIKEEISSKEMHAILLYVFETLNQMNLHPLFRKTQNNMELSDFNLTSSELRLQTAFDHVSFDSTKTNSFRQIITPSHYTLANEEERDGIIGHEFGHVIYRTLNKTEEFSHEKTRFQAMVRCLQNKHPRQNGKLDKRYTEEDFADTIGGLSNKYNMACGLLTQENNVYTNLTLTNQNENDTHSSPLFRTLNVHHQQHGSLPSSCHKALERSTEIGSQFFTDCFAIFNLPQSSNPNFWEN